MNDVTIPADEAKAMAEWMRGQLTPELRPVTTVATAVRWANLLDPKPPSLHDLVAQELSVDHSPHWHLTAFDVTRCNTSAVLNIVADWLEAQPLIAEGAGLSRKMQRAIDVRLVRGEQP